MGVQGHDLGPSPYGEEGWAFSDWPSKKNCEKSCQWPPQSLRWRLRASPLASTYQLHTLGETLTNTQEVEVRARTQVSTPQLAEWAQELHMILAHMLHQLSQTRPSPNGWHRAVPAVAQARAEAICLPGPPPLHHLVLAARWPRCGTR